MSLSSNIERLFVPLLILCVFLSGCVPVRHAKHEPEDPAIVVTRYLKGMFDPTAQRETYDLLTSDAESQISYPSFASLRSNETSALVGSRTATDTRVSVSLFDRYDFSDDHAVVYALLTVRHPYSIGEREKYALVRLHCHRENEQWAIQPFLHSATGTAILVPTRLRGFLWRISRDMERIAAVVKDEIAAYGTRKEPPPEKVVAAESPEEPPVVVPDIPPAEAAESPAPEVGSEKKIDALLSIGRLCYEAGKIDAAEEAFRRVLSLDPDSSVAKDYISRCENYRALQKEKEDAARLIEELLELESQNRSPK